MVIHRSKEIIYKIDSLKDISIVISDSAKSKELVIKGKYACALIIYKGFQDSLEAGKATAVELIYDRSRELEIGIIRWRKLNYITNIRLNILIETIS